MPTTVLEKLAYRVKEAGPALSLPTYRVREAIRRGELTPRHIPGTRTSLLSAAELLAWFNSLPPTPPYNSKSKTETKPEGNPYD